MHLLILIESSYYCPYFYDDGVIRWLMENLSVGKPLTKWFSLLYYLWSTVHLSVIHGTSGAPSASLLECFIDFAYVCFVQVTKVSVSSYKW